MSFEKDKYLKARDKREELIQHLELIDAFIKEQEDFLDKEFNDSLEPDSREISDTLERVKKISRKVDTEKFCEEMKEIVGADVWGKAVTEATTLKTSFNRTNFSKELIKNKVLPDIAEVIKAVEEKNSEKTIKFETIDVSK